MKKCAVLFHLCLAFLVGSCSSDSTKGDEPMDEVMIPLVRTLIPDLAFERALIELNIDDVADGSVITADIANVTTLVMNDKGISDLTGLEDFPKLDNLWVNDNEIKTLDVSRNPLLKFVFAENNAIVTLVITNLADLEKLEVSNNELSQLNLMDNSALQLLGLKNNFLTSLDIAAIPNSIQLNTFSIENNPLTCIVVNSEILNNVSSRWTKDAEDAFALECN